METARLFAELERERAALAGGLAWEAPSEFLRTAQSKIRPRRIANTDPDGGPDAEEDDDLEDAARRTALESLRESLTRRAGLTSDRQVACLRRRATDEAARCALRLPDLSALLTNLPNAALCWSDLHFIYLRIQTIVEILVGSHLGLVERYLRDHAYTERGLDADDLHQEGAVGLIVGVDKYKFRLGMPFPRYAMRGIFGRVQRALTSDERLIRIPSGTLEAINRVCPYAETLERTNNRKPEVVELATGLHLSPRRVAEVLEVARVFDSGHLSLDDPPPGSEPSARTLGERLVIDEPGPHDLVETAELRARAATALAMTERRPNSVLRLRFGFDDDSDGWTLSQVGDAMGLSRERIRQIEVVALERMRQLMSELGARLPALPAVEGRDVTRTPPRVAPSPAGADRLGGPAPSTAASPLPSEVDEEAILDLNEASLIAFRNWVHREGRLKDSTGAMLTSVLRGARRSLGASTSVAAFTRWGAIGSNASAACRHFLAFVVKSGRIARGTTTPTTPGASARIGATPTPVDLGLTDAPAEVPPDVATDLTTDAGTNVTTGDGSSPHGVCTAMAAPTNVGPTELALPPGVSPLPVPAEGAARAALLGLFPAPPLKGDLPQPGGMHRLLDRSLHPSPAGTRSPSLIQVAPHVVPTSEVTRDALMSPIIRLLSKVPSHLPEHRHAAFSRSAVAAPNPPLPLAKIEADGPTELSPSPQPASAPSDPIGSETPPSEIPAEVGAGAPEPPEVDSTSASATSGRGSGLGAVLAKLFKPGAQGAPAIHIKGPLASSAAASLPELTPWLIRWLARHDIPPESLQQRGDAGLAPDPNAPPEPPAPPPEVGAEAAATAPPPAPPPAPRVAVQVRSPSASAPLLPAAPRDPGGRQRPSQGMPDQLLPASLVIQLLASVPEDSGS